MNGAASLPAPRVVARKKPCPKCGASMIVQRTRDVSAFEEPQDGLMWKCLACGKEETIDMAEQPANDYRIHPTWKTPAPAEPAATPAATAVALIDPLSEAPAWTDAALDRLNRLLGAITSIEQLQAEAERTHGALVAYGVTNLPELPWKRRSAKPASAGTPTAHRNIPGICARCYTAFKNRGEWRYLRGTDSGICRDKAACAERVRTAPMPANEAA